MSGALPVAERRRLLQQQAQRHRTRNGHQDVELERQRPGRHRRRTGHTGRDDAQRRRRQRTEHAQQRQDAGKPQAPRGGDGVGQRDALRYEEEMVAVRRDYDTAMGEVDPCKN